MAFTLKDRVELDELLNLEEPVVSRVVPRWQRKAMQEKKSEMATPSRDRFIPNRAAMDFDSAHAALTEDIEDSPARAAYKAALAGEEDGARAHRVLAFGEKAPAPAEGHVSNLKVLYSQNADAATSGRVHRHIPSAPEKVLDAPDLVDDYYLNLLDWSATNMLAVALGPTVYLWNAGTGDITELMSMAGEEDYVSSVSWLADGSHLAVGTSNGETLLWDAARTVQVRSMNGHSARVSSLAWNQHILSSGSRDSTIVHHDVRQREHAVGVLTGHTQEVCGLRYSPDGAFLASGGNDNLLCIWDAAAASASAPRHMLTDHQAAVKALAWCPFQRGVLASGGGTADRCIKFWNASNGALLNSIDTGSQVCSLLWSQHEKELLSSHGYSQNQLCLWKFPSMAKVKELTGHTARVLHLAAGPDGATVCSAAADETLRFWNVFGEARKKAAPSKPAPGTLSAKTMSIR